MTQYAWWKYLPDLVSFIIATALGCVALLPSPKKSHWFRVCLIVFLVVMAIAACAASMKLKYDAEQSAATDHAHALAYEATLQKKLEGMNEVIEDDIRTKNAHPVILTAYGATGAPEVGIPLGLRANLILTGSKDAVFLQKAGWEILPLDMDITAYPNSERQAAEKAIWGRMAERAPVTLNIPYGRDGTATVPLMSTPLNEEQVNTLVNGHALIYFMEELRSPTTKKLVLSICKFMDSRGEINGCFEHDKTDAER